MIRKYELDHDFICVHRAGDEIVIVEHGQNEEDPMRIAVEDLDDFIACLRAAAKDKP